MCCNGLRGNYRYITVCSRLEQSGKPGWAGRPGQCTSLRLGVGVLDALAFSGYPPTPYATTYQGVGRKKRGPLPSRGYIRLHTSSRPIPQLSLSEIAHAHIF